MVSEFTTGRRASGRRAQTKECVESQPGEAGRAEESQATPARRRDIRSNRCCLNLMARLLSC